jgi:hypothetical protein
MAQETKLVWEELKSSRAETGIFEIGWKVHRAKVLGGWFVLAIHNTTGLTFYPDPEHKWDGGSLT